ncbi:DUF397 domain-containing protein [Streptomyces sp. NPDC048508]|uniref:DUF397 domain-containing protein n=1 Tax=Streptomyces sp. NPDC048508 TaxID=3365561 RepID=UPI00371CF1C7
MVVTWYSRDFAPAVPGRDSRTPHGPVLVFPAAGWAACVSAATAGRLERNPEHRIKRPPPSTATPATR